MSTHKRGRITVQHQPTGAAKVAQRGIGVVHAVVGAVFVIISLTEIIPSAGLFGLPFLAAGAFFAVNGTLLALGRNGFAHRTAYDVETDVEEETIVGILDDVDRAEQRKPSAETHDHIPSTALSLQKRLEQLETLKDAGLVDEEEYREKRKEILKEL